MDPRFRLGITFPSLVAHSDVCPHSQKHLILYFHPTKLKIILVRKNFKLLSKYNPLKTEISTYTKQKINSLAMYIGEKKRKRNQTVLTIEHITSIFTTPMPTKTSLHSNMSHHTTPNNPTTLQTQTLTKKKLKKIRQFIIKRPNR